MAEDKANTELAPASQLATVKLSQLHPHAAQRYVAFIKELSAEVSLDGVKDEDLTAEELARFEEYLFHLVQKVLSRSLKDWLPNILN